MLAIAVAVMIDVQVYVDRDGDGKRGAGEEAVPAAVVGAGTSEVIADADGRARISVEEGWPVWARAFDGYAVPGPWAMAPTGDGPFMLELGLRPLAPPRGPWRFVVASDAHVQRPGEPLGRPEDLERAIAQATGGTPAPRFVIVAGDLMQNSDPDEGELVERAFDASPAPLVPVEGNHDSYDGGVEWRRRFGPELYSFDQGGVHVLVLDSMRPVRELVAFAAADLATVDPSLRVIAVTHGPPEIELADALDGLGVELVLAGHWHVNRTLHRGDLLELDTEPWIMGGMDQTPGGYRVVEVEPGLFGAKASLRVEHYTTAEVPVASLVGPAPGQCVAPGAPVPLIVALAGGPDLEPPRATVDGGPWITLARAGGWDWIGTASGVERGRHQVTIRAGRSRRDYVFEACAPRLAPVARGSWPQLGGGPGRTGASLAPLDGDGPLAPRWIAATGGHLGAGSPIVAGGLVIVAPIDLADDQTSAVVALALDTGETRWRVRLGTAVRNAVAADEDLGVVVAAGSDGVVYGLALDTGEIRWRVDLGARVWPEHRAIWGAPLVAGGRAFVGNQRRFAAIELRTGQIAWEVDQVPDTDGGGSFASPALVDGVIVTVPNRALSGVQGWDPATGAQRWATIDQCSLSAAASPVADGAIAHVLSGAGLRCTVDAATGDTAAYGALDKASFEWAYSVAATPALARGTLVAVTQFGEAFAFDTASDTLRWARPVGGVAAVHAAHYRVAQASLAASPVIAADAVWIGTADGDVYALDLATGRTRAKLHVGAPVLDGLAIAGDSLVVASYDGTVRVYAPVKSSPRVVTLVLETAAVAALYGALGLLARRRSRPRRRRL